MLEDAGEQCPSWEQRSAKPGPDSPGEMRPSLSQLVGQAAMLEFWRECVFFSGFGGKRMCRRRKRQSVGKLFAKPLRRKPLSHLTCRLPLLLALVVRKSFCYAHAEPAQSSARGFGKWLPPLGRRRYWAILTRLVARMPESPCRKYPLAFFSSILRIFEPAYSLGLNPSALAIPPAGFLTATWALR